MKSTDAPIIIEVTFSASVDKVWEAITMLDQMKQWYFPNIGSFKPEIGFETRFAVNSGDRVFTHLWKITEVILRQKLSYSWKYAEYPGDSMVFFELREVSRCFD